MLGNKEEEQSEMIDQRWHANSRSSRKDFLFEFWRMNEKRKQDIIGKKVYVVLNVNKEIGCYVSCELCYGNEKGRNYYQTLENVVE